MKKKLESAILPAIFEAQSKEISIQETPTEDNRPKGSLLTKNVGDSVLQMMGKEELRRTHLHVLYFARDVEDIQKLLTPLSAELMWIEFVWGLSAFWLVWHNNLMPSY